MSFEELVNELRIQAKKDLDYFKKYGIKSAMLQRVCNQLGLDDDDLRVLVWNR